MHVWLWRWLNHIILRFTAQPLIQKYRIENDGADGEGAKTDEAKAECHQGPKKDNRPVDKEATDEQHNTNTCLSANEPAYAEDTEQ